MTCDLVQPFEGKFGFESATFATDGTSWEEPALAVVRNPDEHAHEAVLLEERGGSDTGHKLVENHGADALEHLVLLGWAIGNINVDKERIVAFGLGGWVTSRLVDRGLEHLLQIFPKDALFGNNFDVRFVDKIAKEWLVEFDVWFHEDVFSRLNQFMESFAPDTSTWVYVYKIAATMTLEGGTHKVGDVI